MNVFFIHTSFQLLVAQFVLKEFNLTKSKLCISSTGSNREAQIDVIIKLVDKSCWAEIYRLENLDYNLPSIKNPKSFWDIKRRITILNKKLSIDKTTNFYFGDLNHPTYIFLIHVFRAHRIYIFEEGIAHYKLSFFKKKI